MPAISVRTSAAPDSIFEGNGKSRSVRGASNRSSTEALAVGITPETLLEPDATFNVELAVWRPSEQERVPSNDCRINRAAQPAPGR